MTAPLPRRLLVALLVGVIVGLLVVGGAVVVLDVADDGADEVAVTGPAGSPTSSPHGAVSPSATAVASPTASATPSAAPTATPTTTPQADAPLRDLAALVPERVAGFTRAASRPARRLLDGPQVEEARRVRYRNDDGEEVLHLVALHRGNAAAGEALRQRRAHALDRRGARVVDDTGLEDSDGVRRGRLLQIRTRSGEIIVLWRNRNLVARLGPGRARLQRRLYDAWPY